jgi:hypothetical protein
MGVMVFNATFNNIQIGYYNCSNSVVCFNVHLILINSLYLLHSTAMNLFNI